jgi:hypothetical protein
MLHWGISIKSVVVVWRYLLSISSNTSTDFFEDLPLYNILRHTFHTN